MRRLSTEPTITRSDAGSYTSQWHLLMAATTVVTVPVPVLFLSALRYFIEGPPDRPHRHQDQNRRAPLGVPHG